MAKSPLSPVAWVDAGLKQLATVGPSALRAEPLSRHLKTTKGSFYWHFKDVPTFQAAVLETWARRVEDTMAEDRAAGGTATDKLIRFGQGVQGDAAGPSMRAWAQSDRSAVKTLAKVDKARIARLKSLMSDIGITNDDFVNAAYGSLIGLQQTHIDESDALVAYAALVDVVLAQQ